MQYDITFHPKWWHKNVGIDFDSAFFDDPLYRVQCDVKMRRALYDHFGDFGLGEKEPKQRPILGTDLLAAGYLHSEILGCEIKYASDNSPQVLCARLSQEAIAELRRPPLEQSSAFIRLRKQAELLHERFGYVQPCINLMGIQNIALDLMGEEVFVAYYTAPDEMHDFLKIITDTTIQLGRYLQALSRDCSGGVTAIVRKTCPNCYLTSNCSVEMISLALYEEFLLEHDNALAQQLGAFGIHHCGQSMEHVVQGYAKLSERLVFAEAGAGSDIAAVRKALPRVWLNARFSPAALLTQTDDEIESTVQGLVQAESGAGGDGKFSISCVGIDDKVSDKAIISLLKACKSV